MHTNKPHCTSTKIRTSQTLDSIHTTDYTCEHLIKTNVFAISHGELWTWEYGDWWLNDLDASGLKVINHKLVTHFFYFFFQNNYVCKYQGQIKYSCLLAIEPPGFVIITKRHEIIVFMVYLTVQFCPFRFIKRAPWKKAKLIIYTIKITVLTIW